MGADEFDQHAFIRIGDMNDQTIMVASDVKDDPIVADEIYSRAKRKLHILWC